MADLEQRSAELDSLTASLSWRLTALLRAIGRPLLRLWLRLRGTPLGQIWVRLILRR